MISAVRLLIALFFYLIVSVASLTDSQGFLIRPFLLYTSGLLFILLNDNIVDIEKSDIM